MSKNNSASTFVLNTIMAFLLSVFLTMTCYLAGINFGVFNKNLIVSSMDTSSYYQNIIDNTLDTVKPLAIPMGLDENVFDHVFTLDETSSQCKGILLSKLNNKAFTPDVSGMKESLKTNITQYLIKNNLSTNEEQQQNIDKFVDAIANEYINNLEIPYITYLTKLSSLFHKVMLIGIPILLILSAFAVFLIIKLNKWWHRGLRFVAYSTIATALMTTVLPALALILRPYKKLNISPAYFKTFILHYIDKSLATFLYVSLIMVAISAALIFIVIYRKKDLKKQAKEHHHHH